MAGFASMKAFYQSMSTIVSFDISGVKIRDDTGDDSVEVKELIRKHVEPRVKAIIDELKASSKKFEDPDFGPTEKDGLGAISLYGSAMPAPAGSKYPKPEDLRWDRPHYENKDMFEASGETKKKEDGEEEEEEEEEEDDDDEGGVWCKHGALFQGGSGANDVIQGQLGDCWFLGALAVMGTKEQLLRRCFWQEEKFREFGMFVCRFYKDTSMMYVIIDDRIPVKQKDGKPIFACCKDPNELWVPLIEKAYSKLHGCYKAIIGGYSHNALADMTGYSPRLVVMKKGFPGFSDALGKEDVWSMLQRYTRWESLMGTSIQSDPKANHKVEAEAGMGLHMGHAYSFLGLGSIQVDGKPTRLVRLRNPWGRGEWEGIYSDRSDEMEREDIRHELKRYKREFNIAHVEEEDEDGELGDFNDGSFFMPFEEWFDRFTSLFVAVHFPDGSQESCKDEPVWTGKRAKGTWSGEAGGNREMASWLSNPKLRFKLNSQDKSKEYVDIFVGLYIKDSRLTMGFDYFKDPLYATPLAFDIVTKDFVDKFEKPLGKEAVIENGKLAGLGSLGGPPRQAPYNFGTTQVEIRLKTDTEYFIVPSLYKRAQSGEYCLTVYAECDFDLEGASKLSSDSKPMVKGATATAGSGTAAVATSATVACGDATSNSQAGTTLTMSKAQYFEKMEALRERLITEAKTLGINHNSMKNAFPDSDKELSYAEFKKALMSLGFNLIDLSETDLQVLDSEDKKSILPSEFMAFFKVGLDMDEQEKNAQPPPPPVDDLAFKATDMEGVLSVRISDAHALREPKAWFSASLSSTLSSDDASNGNRKLVRYDKAQRDTAAERAAKVAASRKAAHLQAMKERDAPASTSTTLPSPPQSQLDDVGQDHPDGADPALQGKRRYSAGKLFPPGPGGDMSPSTLADLAKTSLLSPDFKRLGGGLHDTGMPLPPFDDDARTHKSALYIHLAEGAQAAASKLHADPDLQKAEVQRTKNLAGLRRSVNKQGSALDARTAEIEESGALRKKAKLVEKLGRRNIAREPGALRLLAVADAEDLRSRWWYKPHKDDDLTKLRKTKAGAANIKSFTLPCPNTQMPCVFGTMSALACLFISGKCPGCGATFFSGTGSGLGMGTGAGAGIGALADLSTPGKEALAAVSSDDDVGSSSETMTVTGVARTPVRPQQQQQVSSITDVKIILTMDDETKDKKGTKVEVKLKTGWSKETPNLVLVSTADGTTELYDSSKVAAAVAAEKVNASTAAVAAVATEPAADLGGDIFDSIIERVSIIVESQVRESRASEMSAQLRKMISSKNPDKRSVITKDSFRVFSRAVTAIPSPSVTTKAKPGPVKLGTTPKAKTPGTASVRRIKNATQTEAELRDASSIVGGMGGDAAERYDEVYRRLILIPTVYLSELEGERLLSEGGKTGGSGDATSTDQMGQVGNFAKQLFDRFDNNSDGSISLDEFKLAMRSMNVNISDDDAKTLFGRFERSNDGLIDWIEFSHFFKSQLGGRTRVKSIAGSGSGRPISDILASLHHDLHRVVVTMAQERLKSVEDYLSWEKDKDKDKDKAHTDGDALLPFVLPNSAILLTLEPSNSSANVRTLKQLGSHLTVQEMDRVNSVFKGDLTLLMDFCAAADTLNLDTALEKTLVLIIKNLKARSGGNEGSRGKGTAATGARAEELTSQNVARLWSLVQTFIARGSGGADSSKRDVSTTELGDFFVSIITAQAQGGGEKALSSRLAQSARMALSARAATALSARDALVPPLSLPQQQQPLEQLELILDGVAIDTLCRALVDGISTTQWNRGVALSVSYSAFEAFLREGHIHSIERKLKYLLELELSLEGPTTFALAHVYVNETKTEAVVLLNEPITGRVYKVGTKEDLSALPTGEQVEKTLFPWMSELRTALLGVASSSRLIIDTSKYLSDSSAHLFNPFDTPEEDAAIGDFVGRLRLIKADGGGAGSGGGGGGRSMMPDPEKSVVVAEDPRFIQQLKRLLDAGGQLPFFANCNEAILFFDVDKDALVSSGGTIKQFIFGHIRSYKPLLSFLTAVVSDMRVVLSSYNSGVKVSLPWLEMLAHLTEYRNPYVTAQLKPKFLLPHQYIYRGGKEAVGFTGAEEEDPLRVQRSKVVVDGGSHPTFNALFKIKFQPPKLTSCKLLSTEIHRLAIDGEETYVVLMVREARRDYETDPDLQRAGDPGDTRSKVFQLPPHELTFRFLTIYDPRTATDYQCGVEHGCDLYDELVLSPGDGGLSEKELGELRREFDGIGANTKPSDLVLTVMGSGSGDARDHVKEFAETVSGSSSSISIEQLVHHVTRQGVKDISDRMTAKILSGMGVAQGSGFDTLTGPLTFLQFLKIMSVDAGVLGAVSVGAAAGAGAEAKTADDSATLKDDEEIFRLWAKQPRSAWEAAIGKSPELKRLSGLFQAWCDAAWTADGVFQCTDISVKKSTLLSKLVQTPNEKLVDAEAKLARHADYNGDERITFKDYVRYRGFEIGYNSGAYNFRANGPTPIGEFMRHVAEAAEERKIILGPAITPRLVLIVQNERGKQDELIGGCQMSVSSVLSGSGVGKEQWVKLTYVEPGAAAGVAATGPVKAGSLRVELGFRKQAEIDAEREAAERVRDGVSKSRPDSRAGSRAGSRLNTPRVEAAVGGGDPARVKVLEAKAKEERKRAEDLTKLLDEEKRRAEAEAKRADAAERAAAAASAAAAAAGSGKAAVAAAPDPALLKELADRKRELEETKRLLAAAEAKRPAPAAPAPGPDPKLTAELEAQKRQIADLLREKKAMEEKLARGATQPPASARGAQAQAKTAPAASLSLEGTRPATAAPATASSKQPAGKAKQQGQAWIDWNTHPLPSGWDRKKDAATGRVYYVDHVHKKTQWKHPQYVPPQKDEPDEESQHDEE